MKLLIFDKGRVILANNAAAWEVVQNARNTKKNITMNPNWQKFNCRMRNNGLAKVFVSVNEADAEAIKSAMPNVEFYSLLPTVLVSEVFFTGQGYKIVVDGDRDWCDSGSIMELKAFFDNI